IASSPSSRRWKKEGACTMRTGAATAATQSAGLPALRVIVAVAIRPTYIAVRSERDHRQAFWSAVRAGSRAGGARTRSLESKRADRYRLPYLRSGCSRGSTPGMVTHLRPVAGRGRAGEPGPESDGPTLPEPAAGRVAGCSARAPAVLAVLLHMGRVHLDRVRARADLGVYRSRSDALGGGRRGIGSLVAASRGASRPGRPAGSRRCRGRLAPRARSARHRGRGRVVGGLPEAEHRDPRPVRTTCRRSLSHVR